MSQSYRTAYELWAEGENYEEIIEKLQANLPEPLVFSCSLSSLFNSSILNNILNVLNKIKKTYQKGATYRFRVESFSKKLNWNYQTSIIQKFQFFPLDDAVVDLKSENVDLSFVIMEDHVKENAPPKIYFLRTVFFQN